MLTTSRREVTVDNIENESKNTIFPERVPLKSPRIFPTPI